MDFGDTPSETRFRSEARDWLEQTLKTLPWPEPADLHERLSFFRVWQGKLHGAGYAGLAWPARYGGRGASIAEQAIFAEELNRAGAPDRVNSIGESYAGPTIIDFGSDSQKQRFLGPILTGEEIWCQLFSEPGAGSDLAGLQCRAERDGDGWRITGQKVWTSRAQIADWAILLARTGGPRHGGITYFLFPMRQDGVTIRPLRQMTGESEFSEVYLDGAHVPGDCVLGEIDDGWRIARATLQYERVAIAAGRLDIPRWIDDLLDLVRQSGHAEDPLIRQRAGDLWARALVNKLNGARALTAISDGAPGPESSIGKLYMIPLATELADFALEVEGLGARVMPTADDMHGRGLWQRRAYMARGLAIAGGTTNIQRNIVAERVLGLPR
ncbi:MAG: acyl-CoA dehydrogenase family protein [Solirubrobacterales bacterium]